MKNEPDQIVSWNAARGFGHTRKGVFVHVSTLCWCVRPSRGEPVAIGTRLFVTSELSPKGEKATSAKCEKCSGPTRWELRDVETATHPITGEVAVKREYKHAGGEYIWRADAAPKVDNTEFDRVRETFRSWDCRNSLYEDVFGAPEFVSIDGNMRTVTVRQSGKERKVTVNTAIDRKPEWFRFVRTRVVRDTGKWRGRASIRAVLAAPNGETFEIGVARSYRGGDGQYWWELNTDRYHYPPSVAAALAPLVARMKRVKPLEHRLAKLWRDRGPVVAQMLYDLRKRLTGEVVVYSTSGSWTESYPESDDGYRAAGSYTVQGTIHRYRIAGFEKPEYFDYVRPPYDRDSECDRAALDTESRSIFSRAVAAMDGSSGSGESDLEAPLLADAEFAAWSLPDSVPSPHTNMLRIEVGPHGVPVYGTPTWNTGERFEWTFDRAKAESDLSCWCLNGRERAMERLARQTEIDALQSEIVALGIDIRLASDASEYDIRDARRRIEWWCDAQAQELVRVARAAADKAQRDEESRLETLAVNSHRAFHAVREAQPTPTGATLGDMLRAKTQRKRR